MTDLTGRIALVTGGSRGIGAATVRALAAAGARVIATDVAAPEALAAEVDGWSLALDVTQERAWTDAMEFAQEEAGGLDILVNNAGILITSPLKETSLEDWRRVQSVNVEGVFLGCKYAVPLIAERAARWAGGGSIINMSSIAGLRGTAAFTAYSASKGAVRLMTKSLAHELAGRRIRVNSVHPGLVETEMGRQLVSEIALRDRGDPTCPSDTAAVQPLDSAGAPHDIAHAVVFLASDKAAFMNGSEFVIDGGQTA
ncbi:3-alpha-(or 20-beta)-hydroxysteroid dehydrogenase [Sphingobium chlorophenolicum L-1]|uniref:3-alpha-(Or 20-beta)-hydroxysteroid dehydrogenase n=1 Tax=Sphingobium chlorophenolicum L-1 TaxID=690566 RepID=F6F3C7_SPHCR|nr:glucose 1-dehydrogenase [Sphingobium chlorophenolicum]AEG50939.1 3-alpha-(or 20-beta)-hydroxysteroid dehydrogenase [Sphingobium chlorophenolicum L-1]